MKKFDLMSLDGRQIALFVAIYEQRSVSAAADEFDITQSSASHTLEKVRQCLGDPLFIRSGRTLEPTDRAHEIAPLARELVMQFAALQDWQSYDPRLDPSPFTIATNVTEFLPEIGRIRDAIKAEAPDAKIRFLELGSREMAEKMLIQNTADVIVSVNDPTTPPFLNKQKLAEDDFACFYDPKSRGPVATIEDYFAAEHGVLDFGGKRKSTVAVALDEYGQSRNITLAAASVMAMGQLILGTQIIMTMQSRLAMSAFSELAWCPPPFKMPKLTVDLVWHRRSEMTPRNKWLRQIIVDAFDRETERLNSEKATG